MFLKLEENAEERQMVVRCGGVNRSSVLPVATSALEGVVVLGGICLRDRGQGAGKLGLGLVLLNSSESADRRYLNRVLDFSLVPPSPLHR